MKAKAHALIGAGAGSITGFTLALRANREPTFPEVCGWVAGGISGAKLPDLLEPAHCPNHRKFCHSGSVLAADLAFLQSQTLQSWIQALHDKAAEHRSRSLSDPENALVYSICALLCEFLAGVLPALFGGYASHLLADSTTPCGIPFI